VRRKTVRTLRRARLVNDLLDRPYCPTAACRRVTKKQIRRKRDAIAHAAAENVTYRHTPRLSEKIEARKFDCRNHLRAIVVKRGCGIGEQKPHFFEPRRIAADEIRLQRADCGDCRFAAAAHFAEAD
jgi:hypothetical protein